MIRRGDPVSTITGGTAAVGFDPDVFADALDFLPGAVARFARPVFPVPPFTVAVAASHHLGMPAVYRARLSRLAAMVIVLPSARVNPRFTNKESPLTAGLSAICPQWDRRGVQIPFIAILKLPFKFDRS